MIITTPVQDMHRAFENLYPDIDPATPVRATRMQRISLCVAVGALAFGAATGHLIILGAGLIFVIFALTMMTAHPGWRIRREARVRFPHEPWATTRANRLAPAFWLLIAATCLAVFYFAPTIWGGAAAAAVAVLATWFMPGLSPSWRR